MTWALSAVGEVLLEARSGFACGEDVPDGVFQFRMNNVTPEGLLDYSRQRRVPRTSPRLDSFLVEAGDVLFNATNSPELVGKTAFFPGHNEPVAFSNHFLRLRPDARQLDGRFLARWLQLQFQRGVFQGLCRQWVNQATVGRDALLGLRLPLPPLAEQRRIASILDRADALRAKRRAALAHLDALPQSLFADLFGAQETLLKKWSTQRLGDLLDFLTSGSRGWATYYASAGDIFLRIQNVRSDELLLNDIAYVRAPETAEALRTRVQPGDVLLSITADLGRTAVVPDDLGVGYINQHLSILRSTRIRPRFLSGYLASSTGQRQINGRNRQGVKAGLNFDDIRSLVIPVPPAALQADFEARLESVAALKASTKSSLAHLDALFACLQYRAFRGEL